MKTTTISGRARFCAPALFKHDVTIEGTLRYRHLKGMDCGLFSDFESLCQTYPDPRPGMYALLINPEDAGTYLLYACQHRGEWVLLRSDAHLDPSTPEVFDDMSDLNGKTTAQKAMMIPSANAANEMGACLEANRLSGNIIHMKTDEGVYIDSSGEEVASASYATHIYLVRRGFSFIHVAAKIGPSAYITVCDKDGAVIARYKGTSGSPYTFDKDVYLDEGACYVKIPAMVSGTLTVTDVMPGDHTDFAYKGEVADLIGTQIPPRQGYLKNDGTWQKALSYFHYVIPLKEGVSTMMVKTNIQPFVYQFFAEYSSAAPYATVNDGQAPSYIYAENHRGEYLELAENAEHIISVPRDARFLYLSATENRLPLSLILSKERYAEKVKGLRLMPVSVENGKYINDSDEVVTNALTNLFTYNVEGKEMLYIKARLASLGMNLLKDGNDQILGRFKRQWAQNGVNTDAVYRVPEGATTLLLSTACNHELVVADVSESEADNCANMFATKKVAFLGDSITAGVGASDDNHRYSSVFSSLARCFEVNLGMNGTCLAANTKNGKTADRFITRATQENIGDADAIFVFGGTNDFTYDNKAIGDLFVEETIVGTDYRGTKRKTAPQDNETFAGALHELIMHIRSVNSVARLIFIAPMTRGVWHKNVTPPSSAETNANGDYLQDYIHAIREICAFYSVPVVDMTSLINQYWGNDSEDDRILQPLDDDGIHPNDAGHARIARALYDYCFHNL